jgi:hypothetical protein
MRKNTFRVGNQDALGWTSISFTGPPAHVLRINLDYDVFNKTPRRSNTISIRTRVGRRRRRRHHHRHRLRAQVRKIQTAADRDLRLRQQY